MLLSHQYTYSLLDIKYSKSDTTVTLTHIDHQSSSHSYLILPVLPRIRKITCQIFQVWHHTKLRRQRLTPDFIPTVQDDTPLPELARSMYQHRITGKILLQDSAIVIHKIVQIVSTNSSIPTQYAINQTRSHRIKLYRHYSSQLNSKDEHFQESSLTPPGTVCKFSSQLKQHFQTYQYWHQSSNSVMENPMIHTVLEESKSPQL